MVFPSIDRAARSVADMIDIDAILRDAKVGVIFVREGVDTSSPMGQFFRNVCASVAQFEGKLMYERLSKGKQRKAALGGYIGGFLPFGYKKVNGLAAIDGETAEVVRLIFRMRIEGKSYGEIVIELKRRNVKTARGGRWGWGAVGCVLGNPYYAGWLRRGGKLSLGRHEPIVSVKTFNKAQGIFRWPSHRRLFGPTVLLQSETDTHHPRQGNCYHASTASASQVETTVVVCSSTRFTARAAARRARASSIFRSRYAKTSWSRPSSLVRGVTYPMPACRRSSL